jgi:cytochrome c556
MSYAVKIGTTEIQWIHDAPTPEGHVRFDGELVRDALGFVDMVWDNALTNIRPKNQAERDADNAALAESTQDRTDFRDRATQAIADITAYLVNADTATNAQIRAEVKAIDQRQRAIIRALRRLL